MSPERQSSRGAPRLEDSGSYQLEKRGHFGLGSPSSAPLDDGSRGARGGRGRSPARQASLPGEQEAEPRPADLLLEVRGQGRPSRPHFLQPRPTPCGPRVYGNSGLDGFSEIIRSLCPHLTPPAPTGTRTRTWRPGKSGEGRGALLRGLRSGPSPNILFLNWAFTDQNPGSAFHLHNLLGGGLYENPRTEGLGGQHSICNPGLLSPPESSGLQNFSSPSTQGAR